jgi:VanZ family protein
MNKPWVRWLALGLWMIVIYLFSAMPNSGEATEHLLGPFNIAVRKLAHVTEYGVLFALANNAIRRGGLVALPFTIAYACSDEWHQSFVPGRTATVCDVLVDTVGMLICWAGLAWVYSRRARRS